MEVLVTYKTLMVHLCLIRVNFYRKRVGAPVPLFIFAGGAADNTSAIGGTFSLSVADLFTKTGESYGSAYFFSLFHLYII